MKVKFKPEVRDIIEKSKKFWSDIHLGRETMSYSKEFLKEPYFEVLKKDGMYCILNKGELYRSWLCIDHVEPYKEFNITIEDELFEI